MLVLPFLSLAYAGEAVLRNVICSDRMWEDSYVPFHHTFDTFTFSTAPQSEC